MAEHKFSIGKTVRFKPDRGQSSLAGRGDTFIIVRLLPETTGALQYQMTNQLDGHERVAREDQLADL